MDKPGPSSAPSIAPKKGAPLPNDLPVELWEKILLLLAKDSSLAGYEAMWALISTHSSFRQFLGMVRREWANYVRKNFGAFWYFCPEVNTLQQAESRLRECAAHHSLLLNPENAHLAMLWIDSSLTMHLSTIAKKHFSQAMNAAAVPVAHKPANLRFVLDGATKSVKTEGEMTPSVEDLLGSKEYTFCDDCYSKRCEENGYFASNSSDEYCDWSDNDGGSSAERSDHGESSDECIISREAAADTQCNTQPTLRTWVGSTLLAAYYGRVPPAMITRVTNALLQRGVRTRGQVRVLSPEDWAALPIPLGARNALLRA